MSFVCLSLLLDDYLFDFSEVKLTSIVDWLVVCLGHKKTSSSEALQVLAMDVTYHAFFAETSESYAQIQIYPTALLKEFFSCKKDGETRHLYEQRLFNSPVFGIYTFPF
jgi:hypothetical protein